MSTLRELESELLQAMHSDQFALRKMLRTMQQAEKSGRPFDRTLVTFRKRLEESVRRCERRQQSVPKLKWDEQHPVVERRQEIADAIREHQVVIVCGETGSGKSTQLPRIALELGRGIRGLIGHTQPRRIAARSVAARIAEELGCPLGKQVGYRIRFQETSGPDTLIRLMTDGIMLAETQSDRYLDQYDTIIIDEAHERSLNIDFLMGYLKRLLPKRRDLRLIITSATIDAERFAMHFGTEDRAGVVTPAPVILVSGRTWPVEVRYRPLEAESATWNEEESEPKDWMDGVVDAVDELTSIDSGHILVFLPTERDIRDVDRKLSGRRYPGDTTQHPTQIVPLFGRLSSADQDRVFRPYDHRRIVLATNVAESSLTVPGIRYVVDTGTARISRYSARSRMQRLPIEAISQASARQRSGRCGRTGPGVCIRLYSEQDFTAREAFTAPEIQRTNLAAVILRTLHLQLGNIAEFPFLDPPRPTTIREGYKTLEELGAITADGVLTEIGRRMARMPVDPRISRMVLAAVDEQCLPEVLAIAAVLEAQDPRDRPIDKQQQADTAHAKFRHKDSDFLTLLNLWDAWHENSQKLSGGQIKKWCRQNFLSWLRMREWVDVYRQLKDLLSESEDDGLKKAAAFHPVQDRRNDFAAIHRALMTGLLANLAFQNPEGEYVGAGGNKLTIWPGSSLASKGPKWFVAAELVETSRRYARTIARIQPEWIEPLASHLVSREYSEPHWDARAGNIMAFEKVTLWGMPVVARRKVAYSRIDPTRSRELLILHGLVELGLLFGETVDDRESEYAEEEEMLRRGTVSRVTPGRVQKTHSEDTAGIAAARKKGWGREFPFLEHNHRVLQQIEELQHRTRRHDMLPTDETMAEFYGSQIPADVTDRDQLRRWYQRTATRDKTLLQFDINQFTDQSERSAHAKAFPETAQFGAMHLPLTYQLDPGRDADGVTVIVPAEGLEQLSEARLSWLVPGLLEQKVLALIRSLPKDLRRHFVPAPETAKLVTNDLDFGKGDLLTAAAQRLSQLAGEPIVDRDFETASLPDHLRFNIQVLSNEGKVVAEGRDLSQLRQSLITKHQASVTIAGPAPEEQQWHRKGFTAWEFADVPERIVIERAGMKIESYPSLRDDLDSVGLTLCQTPADALRMLRFGLRRLILLQERKRLKTQIDHLPQISQVRVYASAMKGLDINHQLMLLAVDRAFLAEPALPRNRSVFDRCLQTGRNRLSVVAQEFTQLIPALFQACHETRRALETARGPGWDPILQDMKQQMAALLHSEFITDTPWPWLIQFPRYLATMRLRLQRMGSGGLKTEQSLLSEYLPWQRRYEDRRAQHEREHRRDPMLDHYRWMLEEFRVSLFAQKLGTAIAVSTKKLDEQWQRVT